MRIDPKEDRDMLVKVQGGLKRTVRRPWLQLLSEVMTLCGGEAELLQHSEQPWASVTFSGSRHCIVLSFTGESGIQAGEDFIEALPDHEFSLSGHIVADANVMALSHELTTENKLIVEVELLLLEDR